VSAGPSSTPPASAPPRRDGAALPLASAAPGEHPRGRRMRAPLLIGLWVLLGFEALGGLLIFFMRLATGGLPGETLHVAGGALLVLLYAIYQLQHWFRVAPWRSRLDYAMGLIAALSMAGALGTGLWLAAPWWQARIVARSADAVAYPSALSAAHNVMSMLVLTFVGAHLAAVLLRDAAARRRAGG